MIVTHSVQVTADAANVLSGTIAESVPTWARRVLLQFVFSDSDCTIDATIGGREVLRNSAPHRTQADNVQQFDWNSPYVEWTPAGGRTTDEIIVDIDVTTGGVGMVLVQFQDR